MGATWLDALTCKKESHPAPPVKDSGHTREAVKSNQDAALKVVTTTDQAKKMETVQSKQGQPAGDGKKTEKASIQPTKKAPDHKQETQKNSHKAALTAAEQKEQGKQMEKVQSKQGQHAQGGKKMEKESV